MIQTKFCKSSTPNLANNGQRVAGALPVSMTDAARATSVTGSSSLEQRVVAESHVREFVRSFVNDADLAVVVAVEPG